MRKFIKQSEIAASVETVFAFHERPDAISQLTPDWAGMTVAVAADKWNSNWFPSNLEDIIRSILDKMGSRTCGIQTGQNVC